MRGAFATGPRAGEAGGKRIDLRGTFGELLDFVRQEKRQEMLELANVHALFVGDVEKDFLGEGVVGRVGMGLVQVDGLKLGGHIFPDGAGELRVGQLSGRRKTCEGIQELRHNATSSANWIVCSQPTAAHPQRYPKTRRRTNADHADSAALDYC
jgi:hypothetical protein